MDFAALKQNARLQLTSNIKKFSIYKTTFDWYAAQNTVKCIKNDSASKHIYLDKYHACCSVISISMHSMEPKGIGKSCWQDSGEKEKTTSLSSSMPILRKLFKCDKSMFNLEWFFRLIKPPSIWDINLNDKIFLCPDHSFNWFLAARLTWRNRTARKYLAATLVRRYLRYQTTSSSTFIKLDKSS